MNLLDLLFPKKCVGCNKIGTYFCKICQTKIRFTTYQICPICEGMAIDGITHPKCKTRFALDGLTNFFHYDGIIRKAIKLLKYKYVSDLAEEFIELVPFSSLQLPIINYQLPIVVPIPLHSSRLRFRGFNQAEVLGKLFAKRLDIPVRVDILKRIKKTTPQVEMKDRKKRLTNMEDVFSVAPNILISQYPHIFLFDDVFTTGATLRAAANALKQAGAKKVWGVVLAHG